MGDDRVSIGQIKRDISDLVNRVAYRGERIVLTSRGKPKAVLVSLEDYERLQHLAADGRARWDEWLALTRTLGNEILERRQGQPLDVDALWQAAKGDLEDRDGRITGR